MIVPPVFQGLHVFVLPREASTGCKYGDFIQSVLSNLSENECRRHESGVFHASRRTAPPCCVTVRNSPEIHGS